MNINTPSGTPIVLPGIKPKTGGDSSHSVGRRLTGYRWIPNKIRNHFIALFAELVGTFLFLFFAFAATQIANEASAAQLQASSNADRSRSANAPNLGSLLYISLAFGFSLAVNVWVFFRVSGGLFNPAVILPSPLAPRSLRLLFLSSTRLCFVLELTTFSLLS